MSKANKKERVEPSCALRLEDVLRALPAKEFRALVQRLDLSVDKSKRIDPQAQVARALVALPEAVGLRGCQLPHASFCIVWRSLGAFSGWRPYRPLLNR